MTTAGKKFANPGPFKLTWKLLTFHIFANFPLVRDLGKTAHLSAGSFKFAPLLGRLWLV